MRPSLTPVFGIVLARDQGIARIGCTAQVIEITREYLNGRMDIGVEGRSVFEVSDMLQEKPYFEAIVDYLPDEPDPPNAPSPPLDLLETYRRCHDFCLVSPPKKSTPRRSRRWRFTSRAICPSTWKRSRRFSPSAKNPIARLSCFR